MFATLYMKKKIFFLAKDNISQKVIRTGIHKKNTYKTRKVDR